MTDADSFEDNNGGNNGSSDQPSTPTGMLTGRAGKQKGTGHAGLQSSQVSFCPLPI